MISLPLHDISGLSNVYGSPIMTLAGAPLTTFSALSNGAIHFPSKYILISFVVDDISYNYVII
jgi:hypothetical protein